MPADSMPLSEREREILCLVVTGVTNQEIACRLVISVNTVKVHLRNIFAKIGAESRTEASMWAVQHGLVDIPGKPEESIPENVAPAVAEAIMIAEADELNQPKASPIPVSIPEPAAHAISWPQRLFLIASVLVVFILAFVPPLLKDSVAARSDSVSAFSDSRSNGEENSQSPTRRWTSRAQMPSARTRLAVASVSGWVFAIGGDSAGTVSDAVEAYNPRQNLWQIRRPKTTPVSNVGAAVLNGMIYVPGGMTAEGRPTDVLEAYDPNKDQWRALSALPAPLCAYAIAAYNNRIYLFGGWDGSGYSPEVHIYDAGTDRWTMGTSMKEPRGFAGAGILGDRIFVVGGYDERQEFSLCEEYDPTREGTGQSPWRERAPMSIARGGVAIATLGDMLFAIGGGWQNYLAYNERYDPHSNAWFSFDSPIVGQWRNLGLATVDVNLYAVGGWSGEDLNSNEEYQAIYRVILPMGRP